MSHQLKELYEKYGNGPLPLEELDKVSLAPGPHSSRADGMCAMELAAWIAGQPHTDHPVCVSPVLTRFAIGWNDSLTSDADRDRLIRPLLPQLLRTAGDGQDQARGGMALDWLIREFTPTFLELHVTLLDRASALRALAPIGTRAALAAAQVVLEKARHESAAAWAAAGDAAGAAAWAAAGAAARAAAWDAARAAAWAAAWAAAGAAAWDAAWDAAGAAARDAAEDFLKPTVAALQASAQRLLERMVDPKANGWKS